jgi:hypothetical protein
MQVEIQKETIVKSIKLEVSVEEALLIMMWAGRTSQNIPVVGKIANNIYYTMAKSGIRYNADDNPIDVEPKKETAGNFSKATKDVFEELKCK